MREDDYFKQALGIYRIPSVERLRQRLDEAGADLVPGIDRSSRTMLKRLKAPITGYRNDLVPLDVDVFPQDNSNTKKEGVSRTYKNYDGYAPMAAYLGMEGWCLEVELRPGSQHSQKGFVDFIKRVIAGAKDLSKQPLLVRADSGNDAIETLVALKDAEHTHYIVKWNSRQSEGCRIKLPLNWLAHPNPTRAPSGKSIKQAVFKRSNLVFVDGDQGRAEPSLANRRKQYKCS